MKKIFGTDRLELLGQIIDIFEDFLEEKGVVIENPDRDEAAKSDIYRDELVDFCNIYGMDYGMLESQIEETLINWGLLEAER